jgi:hypothetical protein
MPDKLGRSASQITTRASLVIEQDRRISRIRLLILIFNAWGALEKHASLNERIVRSKKPRKNQLR